MKVKFWGVNGSIASPCDSQQIFTKVERLVDMIQPEDLKDETSKQNFIDNLPHSCKGTYKGNTSCVQVSTACGKEIILDTGTGARKLALSLLGSPLGKGQGEVFIFYSHLHWDHIQGFPFFVPAYIPGNKIHIHGVIPGLEENFKKQMTHPFFPVLFDQLGADVVFREMAEGEELLLGDSVKINSEKLYHPQVSHAFRVDDGTGKTVYMTDSEFHMTNMELIQNAVELVQDSDVFIFDCQFTFQDAISKIDWGHSSVFTGIDIATSAGAKALYLFHHEPAYDDFKIEKIMEEAFKYRKAAGNKDLQIVGAYDGLEVVI